MQAQSNHDIQNANGSASAPAPNRKPPKLRPPKLRKGSTSDPGTNGSNEQRVNGVSGSIKSNSPSANLGSNSTDPRQNDRRTPSPQAAPQVEKQNHRTRHHRRARRISAESQDPYQGSSEQRTVQERRVSHMLNPPETQGQIERASELVPKAATGPVEQVTESTEVKPQSAKNDQLKLRLDLNLDVEVELKAKIRGDLTLQLLQ
ncbi:hypothetical protein N7499_002489 [Penicillium canescens]|uniref:Uncharacterized protein n=1 Tax=Penicillium canescens TaxID=5083 RepID=A0AAD6I7V4_PENCN|nr:uncharacterized protein N7446_010088 [Penicillium canescens]KAJ6001612.1 hypothetical protein N7522_006839 [Penicillium canescens]KAJ6035329.1 hypothetical protein N7460_009504 [Penicillium canescens]KAJ6037457.1 hypothetical protein N7444_010162 [Penicillium canescens]KAJ6054076.1 hypothetical protein N7446_010088 [Penicillium canescens]KAJ6098115.1 hypothetical protein N7499_002489 [Penicillium canescens]